jgi:flagellar L-ring protein precursor FlgH
MIRNTFALALLLVGPASAAAQSTPDSMAPVHRPAMNWTADARSFAVGDIISVLIDEYTIASADRSTTAAQDRSRRTGLDVGYSGTGTRGTAGATVRSTSGGESRQRGRDTRQDRLASELTARVVAIEPGGVLRIEGRKQLVIDEHQQTIIVRGLARPSDVLPGNVIDSWRLADAEVSYETNGSLGKPKGGIVGRILDRIWP